MLSISDQNEMQRNICQKSRLGHFFPFQRNNISDQNNKKKKKDQTNKKTHQIILLRAPQVTHPSVNWSMFSISLFKSTLFSVFTALKLGEQNFSMFFFFLCFPLLFFTSLYGLLFSVAWPYLNNFEPLQACIKTESSKRKG